MNVLLLNPPGEGPFLIRRGNYCSDISKARYLEPAVDLLILSGILSEDHQLSHFDGVVSGMSAKDCCDVVESRQIDAVVVMVSFVVREHDVAFVQELRRRFPRLLIVACGDVARFDGAQLMKECPELDGVLLDFTSRSICRFLAGEREGLPNLVCKEEADRRPVVPVFEKGFDIPVPRHELFMDPRYLSAVAIHRKQAITIMSFGCPSQCSFCTKEAIAYKMRSMRSAKAEMLRIRDLGYRDVRFADATFAVSRAWTEEFLEFMASEVQLPWWCSTRADNLDAKLVRLMKRSGCHSITIGVETASDDVNESFRKESNVSLTKTAFDLCRRAGIRTLGHFIIGLPGETVETTRATIDYAIELDPFYAAFNLAEAMAGTSFGDEYRRKFGSETKQDAELAHCFPSKVSALSFEQAQGLRDEAVRRFYFRPKKIARQLCSARSTFEVEKLIVHGLELLRRHLA